MEKVSPEPSRLPGSPCPRQICPFLRCPWLRLRQSLGEPTPKIHDELASELFRPLKQNSFRKGTNTTSPYKHACKKENITTSIPTSLSYYSLDFFGLLDKSTGSEQATTYRYQSIPVLWTWTLKFGRSMKVFSYMKPIKHNIDIIFLYVWIYF